MQAKRIPLQHLAIMHEEQRHKNARYPIEIYTILLNQIIAAQVLFECNEGLAQTTAYKHRLKQLIKALQTELIQIVDDDFGLLIGEDANAEVMFNLSDGFKNLVEQCDIRKYITLTPAKLAGLGELLQKFHLMPEWVLHHNGIKITEGKR